MRGPIRHALSILAALVVLELLTFYGYSYLFLLEGQTGTPRKPQFENVGVVFFDSDGAGAGCRGLLVYLDAQGIGEEGDVSISKSNHSCRPTPGLRLGCFRLHLARRGCTLR